MLDTMNTTNPLLDFTDLPLFKSVTAKDIPTALDPLLQKAQQALDQVCADDFPAQWQAMAQVLDVAAEQLGRAWSVVGHLQAVADEPELRAAYNAALPKVTEFWTRMGANERLYAKYKAVDPAQLTPEQQQARSNALRNFVLSGAELSGESKTRFAAIQERLAELSQKFSENVLDATDQWSLLVSAADMAGVPEDVCKATHAAAQAQGHSGHLLNLKMAF